MRSIRNRKFIFDLFEYDNKNKSVKHIHKTYIMKI